jgi:hypothetical protein
VLDPIREVVVMTATVDLSARQGLRQRRMAAAAAFAALVLLVAAALMAATEDIGVQAALAGVPGPRRGRMLGSWILAVLAGLAWLSLAVTVDQMLPRGGGRDLFVVAAASGQAAAWAGVSLGTAAAVPDAHQIPLPVSNAFGRPPIWRARPVRLRWAWPCWGWPPRSGPRRGRCRDGSAG